MNDEFLWCEKYRPKTIAETILPEDLKNMFQQFVDNKNIPNLILCGSAGVGKTTVARAMLEELGCDYIVINGSMNGNIDTLRTEIQNFASSVSFSGGRKYVILDEADYLNCLDENEFIKLSNGELVRLGDMKDGLEYNVISFNTETHIFEEDTAEIANRTNKMVYEIVLECGKTIRCTEDHPLICQDKEGNIVTRTISEGLDEFKIIIEKD